MILGSVGYSTAFGWKSASGYCRSINVYSQNPLFRDPDRSDFRMQIPATITLTPGNTGSVPTRTNAGGVPGAPTTDGGLGGDTSVQVISPPLCISLGYESWFLHDNPFRDANDSLLCTPQQKPPQPRYLIHLCMPDTRSPSLPQPPIPRPAAHPHHLRPSQ